MGKNDDDKNKKTGLFESVNYTYLNEQNINNGTVEGAFKPYESHYFAPSIYRSKSIILGNTYKSDDYIPQVPLSLKTLGDYYRNHNNSIDETYNYLTDFLKNNKDNPEVIQQTVSTIMAELESHFDHSTPTSGAGSTKEIIEKCFKAGNNEKVSGLICGPICNVLVDALKDSGFQASIVPVINNVRHATLNYKLTDGVYVFNNYGKSVVVQANNIKDAISEFNKREETLHSAGTRRIVNTKSTYSEYAFKDAAFRGEELDKHTYNNETPFVKPLNDRSELNVDITRSNIGTSSAEISTIYRNSRGNKETELSGSVGFINKGESSMFIDSKSFGAGFEYKTQENTGDKIKFKGIKCILSQITGSHGGITYSPSQLNSLAKDNILDAVHNDINNIDTSDFSDQERNEFSQSVSRIDESCENTILGYTNVVQVPTLKKSGNLSAFVKADTGKNTTIKRTDDMNIDLGYRLTGNMIYSLDGTRVGNGSGDYRVTGEGGLQIENKFNNARLTTGVSAGGFVEYNEPIEMNFDFFRPGLKLNAETQLNCQPGNNSFVRLRGAAFSAISCGSNNYGIEGNVFGALKDNKSNITFTANGGLKYNRERIKLGYNELTENNLTYNIFLSGQKGNTSVYAGYENHNDMLNNTRDYNSLTLGVQFKL